MRKFDFKENDVDGLDTLRSIEAANRFNEWMYEEIREYCSGEILEIGSGIGNITRSFLEDGASVHASDIRREYIDKLQNKFSSFSNLKSTSLIDIASLDFENQFGSYLNRFDTVFALNVIEHIEDDSRAIQNCLKLLKKGGRLIILVPAYESLYNSIDRSLYHYRRYDRRSLMGLFPQKQNIVRLFSFNFIGIFAWWLAGQVFKDDVIKPKKMRLYNFFVPVFKIIDFILMRKIGLSLITVYKK